MIMGSCCGPSGVRIIKVGTFEAGIVGLEEILQAAAGLRECDEVLAVRLVEQARTFGNYIPPASERLYAEAFLRELRAYRQRVAAGSHTA